MNGDKKSNQYKIFPPDALQDLINKVYEMRRNLSVSQDNAKFQEEIQENRAVLEKLLQYLIQNIHNPEIDVALIKMLADMLGHNLESTEISNHLDYSNIEKTAEEQKLEKEEYERIMRIIIYEIYKMINPKQIAGETRMENFINNATLYGLEAAIAYDKNPNDIVKMAEKLNIECGEKESFVEKISKHINQSNQRGLH